MAGREFGHHLGLPRALSALPLAPLVPGYARLVAAQRAAGLRHIGEILTPGGPGSGAGLRVLDGLFVPVGTRGQRRVDGALLAGLRGSSGPAAPLADELAELHRRDPQALRRVLLYQLIGLLQDRPDDQRPDTALRLGVHAEEAAGLVAAALVRPALDGAQRAAAESLADAWAEHRLRRADRLLKRLPPYGRDPSLTALRAALSRRLRHADAALDAARDAEQAGDSEAATERYLRALRLAADDRRALFGLVRIHRPRPHDATGTGTERLRRELLPESVALTWDAADPPDPADPGLVTWRILRLRRAGRGTTEVRELCEVRQVSSGSGGMGSAEDRAAPLGSVVRYVALPVREGRVAGVPLVARELAVTPEVSGLALTDGRERIDGTWRPPPGATEVTVEHTGPGNVTGVTEPLPCETGRFAATGLPPGLHRFRVVCHYRTSAGRTVASPGVEATRTVQHWPEPVRTLTATAEREGIRFAWTGAEGAEGTEVRLVCWPGDVPRDGAELATAELPEPLPWPRLPDDGGVLCPPPGTHVEVAAVAVLGERAVAGPTVTVEAPVAVTGLVARRQADGQAQVVLDWPEGTGLLTVSWTRGRGRTEERSVAAHQYRRHGLRLPVGRGGVRVRAVPAPRTSGSVVALPAAAETVLPPDASVAYRLVPAPRRILRRGRPLIRVTLSAPDEDVSGEDVAGDDAPGERVSDGDEFGETPLQLPEFVCVARSGTLRPRGPADGTTVLRIAGDELLKLRTVEHELASDPCPAPFTLRGFLLGAHAASVRLEEPSPATLVVR
ncbi:hypothetical protein [Streptomyces aurantiacus]|uniref:hypothetical protein n=1 Tax=Streptomyces aurantiacus TaxID=47760 RepID=UPI0006E2B7DF|nr:hypothetical protein [Streptomyces aurantiacus]